jgi:hypothetical protein
VARIFILVSILLPFASWMARADTLSPRAFTEAAAAAAKAAIPSAEVTVKEDLKFVVRYANGAQATSILMDAYKIYQRQPGRLNDLIQAQAAALLEAGGDAHDLPKVERSLVIPVIMTRQEFDETQQRGQLQTPPVGLLFEPLNNELVAVYAEDKPGALRILSTRDDVGDRGQLPSLSFCRRSSCDLVPEVRSVSVLRAVSKRACC